VSEGRFRAAKWKVTRRFYTPYALLFKSSASVSHEFYRWKWRAQLAAFFPYAGWLGVEVVIVSRHYPDVDRYFATERLAQAIAGSNQIEQD
jgi:hypothetical protein